MISCSVYRDGDILWMVVHFQNTLRLVVYTNGPQWILWYCMRKKLDHIKHYHWQYILQLLQKEGGNSPTSDYVSGAIEWVYVSIYLIGELKTTIGEPAGVPVVGLRGCWSASLFWDQTASTQALKRSGLKTNIYVSIYIRALLLNYSLFRLVSAHSEYNQLMLIEQTSISAPQEQASNSQRSQMKPQSQSSATLK